MTLMVTGIFGALLVTTFLSFIAVWLKAPPLIVTRAGALAALAITAAKAKRSRTRLPVCVG